jgi:hypothetical protein
MSAISPKKSPGPSVLSRRASVVVDALGDLDFAFEDHVERSSMAFSRHRMVPGAYECTLLLAIRSSISFGLMPGKARGMMREGRGVWSCCRTLRSWRLIILARAGTRGDYPFGLIGNCKVLVGQETACIETMVI